MKIQLKSALKMYEQFLNESANEDATVVAPREAMIKDIDSIITSLETLATQVTEDLETEADINEAGEEGAGKKIADFLIFGKKYKKMQQKINAMKIQKADLEFAAAKLPGEQKDKKQALKDKAALVGTQINDLQAMVNDKAKERGSYVQKVLSKTKIEGQMELIKKTAGFTDDKTKIGELNQRMAELKRRAQEEDAAIKQLQDEQPEEKPEKKDDKKEDNTEDKKDDKAKEAIDKAKEEKKKHDEDVRQPAIQAHKDWHDEWSKMEEGPEKAAGLAKGTELKIKAKQADQQQAQFDMQIAGDDAEAKKAAADKVNALKAEIAELQTKAAEQGKSLKDRMDDLKKKEEEDAAKKKEDEETPKETDKEETPKETDKEETPKETPKETDKEETPKETDKEETPKETDKEEKDKKKNPKESLVLRATNAGLNELAEEISSKEDWQLQEGAALTMKYEVLIRKVESDKILKESRYFDNNIKDAFSRLI